jgi:hypothetical protein
VIFDIETNGVARKLQGHTRQIQSLRYDYMTARPSRKHETNFLFPLVGLEMAGIFLHRRKTGSVYYGI